MAKRRKSEVRRGGSYKFTARRRYALKKAQEKSAKQRKNQRIKKVAGLVGAAAAIGTAAYLGNKHIGGLKTRNRMAAQAAVRAAVQPRRKETVRTSNAISVGRPSRTTIIGPGERARAASARAALAKSRPDRRVYNEDDSVNTEAMTNRGVRKTLRSAKTAARGKKTESLKSTPGGKNRITPKARPRSSRESAQEWSDAQWEAVQAFDTPHKPVITDTGKTKTKIKTVATSTARARTPRSAPQRDPMHTLAKMRYEDDKLLGKW